MFQENLDNAIGRILGGESLNDFCDWFVQAQMSDLQPLNKSSTGADADVARSLRHVARQLWGQLPYPPNRWRARGLPKLERNAPCHCGSGRKFKQCCAEFEHMPFPLEPESLQVLALEAASPEWLTGDKLNEVPAWALGHAAMAWNDADEQDRTISLLGPLFADLKSQNERHEMAFDAFVDALQQQGQERERRDLIDHMTQHPNKALATAARTRLVSILADEGEMDKAWQLFQETSRFNPNDPQLWHLELNLLLSQGRQEEARLRAPLLAARARQAGMPDLAELLVGMAEEGIGFLRDAVFDEVDDPDEQSLIDLADAVPEQLDAKTLHSLYKVESSSQVEDGVRVDVARVEPVQKMADLNRRCVRQFERRFLAAYGQNLRDSRRLARYARALAMMMSGPQPLPRGQLTRIAMDAGYHDQAHMVRDFSGLLGQAPGGLMAGPDTGELRLLRYDADSRPAVVQGW
eukprot:gene14501-16647_t